MFKLYNFIEDQINTLISGDDSSLFSNIKEEWLRILVSSLVLIIMIGIYMSVGVLLWNHGLAAVLPNVVNPIGKNVVKQIKNDNIQLLVTLFAIGVLLT